MGLRPSEYYRLTPVEFGLMYSGFLRKETEQKKKLRLLSWFIVSSQCDMKGQTMESWWPIGEEEIKTNTVDVKSWSEEKRNIALSLINDTIGG
ncbi:hypothetical protein ORI89_07495 [Sphingobacterium sp. UT-1RO-CII-1]|uniref:hypothetical protein n=1 Tax=Sphingobacterium sp. UT-1RO-CII-1 TaxID=2995225 RepID=UPI00227D10C4|nr:hypothetical protein [Sphingobacterium sp. UT-1RO-CII-1]MCY4779489.1 hypothetical protein [Sphingobacterium sp. UT-1RO-CII-1]